MFNCGIIGMPMAGKSTIFNLLIGKGPASPQTPPGKTGIVASMAKIPDTRVDFLASLYNPKQTTFAQVKCSDIPALNRSNESEKGGKNRFLDDVRHIDLLVHVCRAFHNPAVPHVEGSVDPLRDAEIVDMELLFADLELLEKRIRRIETDTKIKYNKKMEVELLKKCVHALENEIPLGGLGLTPEEELALQNYSFFTKKPVILAVNTDEKGFKEKNYPRRRELFSFAENKGYQTIELCGQMETEIDALETSDKKMFMSDLGINEPGIARLARAAYQQLNLISFFTVGPDEVKAWTIKKGSTAKQAAGKIHSDIERGFIRAEVISYKDLKESGTMSEAKKRGLVRLEGKEYIVADGDVINIRFNV